MTTTNDQRQKVVALVAARRLNESGRTLKERARATSGDTRWLDYTETTDALVAMLAVLPLVEADTMPTIEVGDTIVHGRPHEPPQFMYEVTDYECRGWQGDANVVAILRTLWRRPSPQEPAK